MNDAADGSAVRINGSAMGASRKEAKTSALTDRAERYALIVAWAVLIVVFGLLKQGTLLTRGTFSTILGSQSLLVIIALGLIIALESLSRTLGGRPHGWYCGDGPRVKTRRLVVEEGGFLYDSDAHNDELPYCVLVGGKPHLVVPYGLSTHDVKLAPGMFGTADDFFQLVRDAFDMLYTEGAQIRHMMPVGCTWAFCHPTRAAGLGRFLDDVSRRDKVWVTRRIDIALHWLAHHPRQG